MLTTDHRINTRLFTTIQETSAATALAARVGAQVIADRPTLWPETIRALIIHSAEWTPAMNAYRTQRNSQEHKAAFLRRYGYGVPDLSAAYSVLEMISAWWLKISCGHTLKRSPESKLER